VRRKHPPRQPRPGRAAAPARHHAVRAFERVEVLVPGYSIHPADGTCSKGYRLVPPRGEIEIEIEPAPRFPSPAR
jgi:hypothetical protein